MKTHFCKVFHTHHNANSSLNSNSADLRFGKWGGGGKSSLCVLYRICENDALNSQFSFRVQQFKFLLKNAINSSLRTSVAKCGGANESGFLRKQKMRCECERHEAKSIAFFVDCHTSLHSLAMTARHKFKHTQQIFILSKQFLTNSTQLFTHTFSHFKQLFIMFYPNFRSVQTDKSNFKEIR